MYWCSSLKSKIRKSKQINKTTEKAEINSEPETKVNIFDLVLSGGSGIDRQSFK